MSNHPTIDSINQHKVIAACAAKLGITNLGLDKSLQGPVNEMHETRKQMRRFVNALVESIGTREETPDEAMAIAASGNIIAKINNYISRAEDAQGAYVSDDSWRNQAGLVRMANKGEQISKGHEKPGFSFGNFLRGAVNAGPRSEEIQNALSSGSDATGGLLIPTFLGNQLIDLMRSKQVCVQAGARTMMLDGATTKFARVSADPAVGWRAESAAVAVADPQFEGVTFAPKSLAVIVKIPFELLQDAVNMSEAISLIFAGAMATELDRVALIGSGTTPEPKGIFGTTNVGVVSMGANGATPTNFVPYLDALSTMRTANASAPTGIIMHPRTARTFDGFIDTTNQPLEWPRALNDVPQLITTSLPINQVQGTSGAVCSTAIMGDFTQLIFGVRSELRITVLNERYADNLQVGFLCHLRADVQLAQPKAFVTVTGIKP
jgi:HK97 family phage major capsid protein